MRFQAPLGMLYFVTRAFRQQSRNLKFPQQRCKATIPLVSVDQLLATKRNDDLPSSVQTRLYDIESQIATLNGGQPINCNSPKQVALALFGSPQSVSKAVLQSVALNSPADSHQKIIAELIIEYRKLQSSEVKEECAEGNPDFGSKGVDGDSSLPLEELSDFDRQLERKFASPRCKVNSFWKDSLRILTRSSAKSLVSQLDLEACPMGYNPLAQPFDPLKRMDAATSTTTAGKKGSFLGYCREQKEKYPECIILTRCGDFYETFGIDAIMLVEHCGLNSMAGKAKAGCPIKNVQATLDCLTEAGFRIAVYEEGVDSTVKASSKSRIKSRFLAQIVSSATPTYLYDLVLQGDHADTLSNGPQARPYVGILSRNAGYTVAEVSIEERTVRIAERLTTEAVACRLAASPPVDPLIYVPSPGEDSASPPFLPSSLQSSRLRMKAIPPSLVQRDGQGASEVDRVKSIVVSELLKISECREEFEDSRKSVSSDDFTVVASSNSTTPNVTITRPLYVETATQLGLMDDKAIPSLVRYMLPTSTPAATLSFVRRYLLTPPPPRVASSMKTLISFLKDKDGPSLPPLSVPPLGKVLSMLRAGQASAQVFAELLKALHSTILILDMLADTNRTQELIALTALLEFESGMAGESNSLRARCNEAIAMIEEVLCPVHHISYCENINQHHEAITNYGEIIPKAFFERNESPWRGRVREDAARNAYTGASEAAQRLLLAVAEDFWGLSPQVFQRGYDERSLVLDKKQCVIVQDIFNNIFTLKEIPRVPTIPRDKFVHPRDRFGKLVKNRYTTARVQDAMSDYVAACQDACSEVAAALVQLSTRLYDEGHIPAVVQATQTNLILSTAFQHAVKANSMRWNLGNIVEYCNDKESAGTFQSVWPYWMDRSEAVPNSFDLKGMWVLTAPNMSGKSTVMRSTAAAALLIACGFCAPVRHGTVIRRFDNLFVRGASSDVPAEGKSAFGAEMGDVAAMLRSCGVNSLVFVDELSRGTSPRDGTRLAGAILEAMARAGMSGIFATHLHDILALPLQSDRLVQKKMAVHDQSHAEGFKGKGVRWTYRLEDGICTDSMALVTAAQFGLPDFVLQRAEELAAFIPSDSMSDTSSLLGQTDSQAGERLLLTVTSEVELLTNAKPCKVSPHWSVPASYDGKSCLYVLQLPGNPARLYVGESDDVRKRLVQHRSKGHDWRKATALIVSAPKGKSQAREWESTVIRKFSAYGFNMESVRDGRTLRAADP